MATLAELAAWRRKKGADFARNLTGDFDPADPLGDSKAPTYEVAVGPISIDSRKPMDGGGDELATPEEMQPPVPHVLGGLKLSDGPDAEPDADADDSAHLATLATASRPPLRTAPTPDESWGTYGDAKALSSARQSDRESMLADMFQRAGRQLISGLTRTPEAATITTPADAEKRFMAGQQSKREAALKALKEAREGRVSDADVELKLAEAEKARRLPVAAPAKPDHFAEEEANKDRRLALEEAGRDRRARIAAAAGVGRTEAKALEDVPPGYEVSAEAHPGAETRKKFTGLVASAAKVKEITNALRQELAGTGMTDRVLPGEKKRALEQLTTALQVESKNIAELGALSGPDYALMGKLAPDPTSLLNNLKGNPGATLDQVDSWADRAVAGGSKAYGVVPKAKGGQAAAPPAGERVVTGKDGKRYVVHADGSADPVP